MTKVDNLLPKNDIHRRIIHLDMDAFYASVEMRDHPEYRKKAVVVGQDPRQHHGHGVVATANYLARKYGVHSAMASIQAVRLIPREQLVIIAPNFAKYHQVSDQVHQIMHEYTDLVQSVALDEAYLDVTHNKQGIDSASQIALTIQERIYHELGLTCSFGVTYNKFLAKMGSEYAKPFGRCIILPREALAFLGKKKIEEFPGVGPRTQAKLHEMQVFTGKDLQQVPVRTLIKQFGKMGYILAEHANGIDLSPVVADSEQNRKSIGLERTFEPPIHDQQQALTKIRSYCDQLEIELKKRNFYASTVVFKIRNQDFATSTKRRKLAKPTNDAHVIYAAAQDLFQNNSMQQYLEQGIRLLGVTTTDFNHQKYQETSLF